MSHYREVTIPSSTIANESTTVTASLMSYACILSMARGKPKSKK